MKKRYNTEVIKMVASAVIGMYENNVLRDCGSEGFVGWCEEGDIFEGTEQDVADATELMYTIADKVDDLTYGYLNTDGFGVCEEIDCNK